MSKTVKFNDDVVEEFEKLGSTFTFPSFVQAVVRESIDRKKRELRGVVDD